MAPRDLRHPVNAGIRPLAPLIRTLARGLVLGIFGLLPALVRGTPVDFVLPAQPVADALLAFSKQANLEVLFSFDELRKVQSTAVTGRYEPENALTHLLRDTGFTSRRDAKGKFVVARNPRPTGSISGRLIQPNGRGAPHLRVILSPARRSAQTDQNGDFHFSSVPPGSYQLTADGREFHPLRIESVQVGENQVLALEPRTMQPADELTHLEPYVVQGSTDENNFFDHSQTAQIPPSATGNLDLPRSENGALPYTVYDREQIIRSGVINLNDFLQRAVLESSASQSPEQTGSGDNFTFSSTNLNLRGYGSDQTVVLVNGRRLPEIVTNTASSAPPDVNFIPLSLIQQIEVMPVSSSALYSGNAVGGVINIVLRSGADADITELTTTYTNAARGFDAPQSSVSFLHGQSLLGGKIHVRINASFTRSIPPNESELGFHQARAQTGFELGDSIYRATPNVRSVNLSPLFGPGTSPVTSVAPGADGLGGLPAFSGRDGLRNLTFFDTPGGLTSSPNSLDYAYGRKQERSAYFASFSYDVLPWLQVGVDGTYSHSIVNRGYDVFTADLLLASNSPFNPFAQDVQVSLNETAPKLGANYSQADLEFSSAVVGLLVKLPSDWRMSLDAQYAHNIVKYRGVFGADQSRWQQLVDSGRYNPLRDTQVYGPPQEFYDQALIYYGGPGKTVTVGNYDTLDAAARITDQSLALPTGVGSLNFGADYRRNHLASYTEQLRFADGTAARDPVYWSGRTLQHYSIFGELQAPLLPARWLPSWLHKLETDLAVRYVAADTSRETNLAPTVALKLDFVGGLAFRASVTTSNRVPTPQLSQPVTAGGGGGGTNLVTIFDPLRNQRYDVSSEEARNVSLLTEAAVTQTAGLIFQRGKIHRFRAALDFADTRKTNEAVVLTPQDVINLESIFPSRVIRAPLAPNDPATSGKITSLLTGAVNAASRHSQNWNLSLDYAWTGFAGGTLELYSRWVYFQKYERQILPQSPMVDELGAPDGSIPGLLRYRANFGAGWSNRKYGFGLDGHYFHSRVLPVVEWPAQGSDHIKPYWQFDAFVQSDLARWLPWKSTHFGLRGQARIDNLFGFDYPKYANDGSGAGVQAYGDWRGRTYSLSLTATF